MNKIVYTVLSTTKIYYDIFCLKCKSMLFSSTNLTLGTPRHILSKIYSMRYSRKLRHSGLRVARCTLEIGGSQVDITHKTITLTGSSNDRGCESCCFLYLGSHHFPGTPFSSHAILQVPRHIKIQ